jgi:hypothetical protein
MAPNMFAISCSVAIVVTPLTNFPVNSQIQLYSLNQ